MPKPGGLWGSALHIYMQTLLFMDVAALFGGSWTCAVRGGAVPGSLGGVRRWPSVVLCGPVQRGSQGENIKTTFFFGKTNFK